MKSVFNYSIIIDLSSPFLLNLPKSLVFSFLRSITKSKLSLIKIVVINKSNSLKRNIGDII